MVSVALVFVSALAVSNSYQALRFFTKLEMRVSASSCRWFSDRKINGIQEEIVGIANYEPFKQMMQKNKGIYSIRNKNGEIEYIGSSNHVDKRLRDHRRSGILQESDTVEVLVFKDSVKQKIILSYEKELIRKLSPLKNKHVGAPGRMWDAEQIEKLKDHHYHRPVRIR